jgi:hypothetical protein
MFEVLSFLKTLEEYFSKDYMDVNKVWVCEKKLVNGGSK